MGSSIVGIAILFAGIVSVYGDPLTCCNFKPQQLNASSGGVEDVNARPGGSPAVVDGGKSVLLRRLVGALASLMRYEARNENPPRELSDRVDGVVVEAETHLAQKEGGRRKAILIIGEIKGKDGAEVASPVPEAATMQDPVGELYKQIEAEKEAERIRRQEWTDLFVKQRQDEQKRRQEWQVRDAEMRDAEIKRRQELSRRLAEQLERFESLKPTTSTPDAAGKVRAEQPPSNTLPADALIRSLFEALESFKNTKNSV